MTASMQSFKQLVASTCENWTKDNGFRLAAALAYYALLSMAPLVMLATAVAGGVFGHERVQLFITHRVYAVISTPAALALQSVIEDLARRGVDKVSGLVATVSLILAASAVFWELQDALNTIWNARPSKLGFIEQLRDRLHSLVLVLIGGMILLISLIGTILGAIGTRGNPSSGFRTMFLRYVSVMASLCVTTMLFALVFKLVPRRHIAWADIWVGSLATAIMFEIGKIIVVSFLSSEGWKSIYGGASSLVVFVAWVYYSALIMYFGAEFAKVYAVSRLRRP
jgi:membrane protein